MVIRNYHHTGHSSYKYRAIEILLYEHLYLVKVFIIEIKLSLDEAMNILSSTSKGVNEICIIKMHMTGITVTRNVIAIAIINGDNVPHTLDVNKIYFRHCMFTNINSRDGLVSLFALIIDYRLTYSYFYYQAL